MKPCLNSFLGRQPIEVGSIVTLRSVREDVCRYDISGWTDIVAIGVSLTHVAGLKSSELLLQPHVQLSMSHTIIVILANAWFLIGRI